MSPRSPFRPRACVMAHAILMACLGGSLSPLTVAAAPATPAKTYSIAAGPLDQALISLGRQAGILIAYTPGQVAGRQAHAVQGNYSPTQALALMLTASGLVAQAQGEGSFVLQTSSTEPAAAVPQRATTLSPATETTTLETMKVVGNWLGIAEQNLVFDHAGARNVIRRERFAQIGATTVREVLNQIPGVNAPENNGTGSHDMAMNFGIRGLNPRLATRSTVLMDGIPVPFAPYGQPQLSLAPLSLGNMDAVDVVRGGGAVRYGPQNVGGIVNFVTRAIPEDFAVKGGIQMETSPSSSHEGFKKTGNLLLGGTMNNGLGGALLYSGTRGSDYREHSATRIDDMILKGRYQIDEASSVHAIGQYYDGEADMPGGLTQAQFYRDPAQSTRFKDRFWGRRTLVSAGYDYSQDQRKFSANAFYTQTLRSGYLDQGNFVSLSPRYYWVRGAEAQFSQGFQTAGAHHELGIGYRYINEASHELRYRAPLSAALPGTHSRNDRDTRGQTKAHAFYIDDRIDIGRWTLTPGIRYEIIDQQQVNLLTATPYAGDYKATLPALNVLYRLSDHWNLFANTEGSFGSVQYSQMPNRVAVDEVKPEKARTWELGTRYDDGSLQAKVGAFLINFDHQYDSSQTSDSVIARGKTRHQGIETSLTYQLSALSPALAGLDLHFNYAFVDAVIREEGPNKGNMVPFSSRHKGMAGVGYTGGSWRLDLDAQIQSSQFADNANTVAESADGSTGRIPGYAVWNIRQGYDFGPALHGLNLAVGVKNLFNREYFTRSFDDNNKGLYLGVPRTIYVQATFDL
ncbi:TonB-dependent Fe(3+) dicitrate receptor FecA [Xanthomonas arboricola]|uniref:TonB-dependent Fe(3+) dicitrate receptor FecA n=1 Tax=Xanthomonas arboricola TaxID=56448 RepID=UPI000CAFDEB5|nr:TonB-dependent Fe(3+) dicitrate receptor FecA [Xanthomonas arboricola]SOT98063.1 citrate-dependent iron transporter [Xanthomonas arboricola pv. fragariae]